NKEKIRGRYFDETPYVRLIAELNANITPHFVPPSKGPILEQIARQIRIGGAPTGGILNGLWVMDILSPARSAGHDGMVGGEMGNHAMSCDGASLLTELLLTGRWLRLIREIISSGYRWKRMIRHCVIAPCIPAPIFHRYLPWRRGALPPWYHFSA